MGNTFDCASKEEKQRREETPAATPPGAANEGMRVIEEPHDLNDSVLWRMQREHYRTCQLALWRDGAIPNFVTSNNHFARSVADVFFNFVKDALRVVPEAARREPVYFLEIGAGSGQFAFHVLRRLVEMKSLFPAHQSAFPFVYIISDLSTEMVAFYRHSPVFAEFVALGVLDFAVFDAERQNSIDLQISGQTIDRNHQTVHPLFTIALYVANSLTQAAYQIQQGEISALQVAVSLPGNVAPESPDAIAKAVFNWSLRSTSVPLVGLVGECLLQYRGLSEATVLFPIGLWRALEILRSWSPGCAFFIGDKGYIFPVEMKGVRDVHVARHQTVSFMVNFHFINRVLERGQVRQFHTRQLDGFKVGCYLWNCNGFDNTEFSLHECTEFGPENFSQLQKGVRDECRSRFPLFLQLLRLSFWDSDIFYKFKQVVLDHQAETANRDFRRDLMNVYESYYPVQASKDIAFEIGRVLMGLRDYERALCFFSDSNETFPPHHATYHNLGVCYLHLRDFQNAEIAFDHCLELRPGNHETVKWKQRLEQERLQQRLEDAALEVAAAASASESQASTASKSSLRASGEASTGSISVEARPSLEERHRSAVRASSEAPGPREKQVNLGEGGNDEKGGERQQREEEEEEEELQERHSTDSSVRVSTESVEVHQGLSSIQEVAEEVIVGQSRILHAASRNSSNEPLASRTAETGEEEENENEAPPRTITRQAPKDLVGASEANPIDPGQRLERETEKQTRGDCQIAVPHLTFPD